MSDVGSSVVVFPPQEKVGLIGPLSTPQVVGAGTAVFIFMGGVLTGLLVEFSLVAVLVIAITFVPWRGQPARNAFVEKVSWLRLREKEWTAPLRGGGAQAPCLRGITYHLETNAKDAAEPAAVVQVSGGAFSVVFEVDSASTLLLSNVEQDARYNAWGEVLTGLCVERGTMLCAERLAWTDVHQASDPAGLIRRHHQVAKNGPSKADYEDHVASFGAVAARHRVVVTATITRAGRLKLAKQQGFEGTNDQIMRQAAVAVGRDLIEELNGQNFKCGPLLSPADLARLVLDACDPFAMRPEGLAARERFGLPAKTGPDQVTRGRHLVEMDGSCHRVFSVRWPRTAVDAAWMHLPLKIDGPKLMTTVYSGIAPSVADRQREALTSRSQSNNAERQARRGRVRSKDVQKSAALLNADKAVTAGHQDLDVYSLVAVSGRSLEEVNRKSMLLRQALRKAGRSDVREMTEHHDQAFAATLPLGLWVKEKME
jgi:hypothetical protein